MNRDVRSGYVLGTEAALSFQSSYAHDRTTARCKSASILLAFGFTFFICANCRPLYADAKQNLRSDGQGLAQLGEKELSTGHYDDAIKHGGQCANVFAASGGTEYEIGCLTIVGRAKVYQGNYPDAVLVLERAADLAHKHNLPESEAAALNDIGSAKYYLGDYTAASHSFADAYTIVERQKPQTWYPRLRQITIANRAMLEQRLGNYDQALDLYRDLEKNATSMRASEMARLFANIGALYRRLGDSYKAVERYRIAEGLLREQADLDGVIGIATNTGIALAMDLDDLQGAISAFGRAERLSLQSGNRRERAEAALYSSEALRRLGQYSEARSRAELALAIGKEVKASEEIWKARLSLGKIAEAVGDKTTALSNYQQAIGTVESLRTGIATVSMRTAFLGDKTEAYDGAVRVLLQSEFPDAAALLHYMEQRRARTLRDRLKRETLGLDAVQRRLSDRTAVLELWKAGDDTAALWITRDHVRVLRMPPVRDNAIEERVMRIKSKANDWQVAANELGRLYVTPLPLANVNRLIIVPDRGLQSIPFEALPTGNGDRLLIDQVEVSYIPAVSLIAATSQPRGWLAPWRCMLSAFAFGNIAATSDLFGETLAALPSAAREIQAVAGQLGGQATLHTASDNLKQYVTTASLSKVPVLHFATHGIADPEDPDRSRLAFSSRTHGQQVEYLFAREIYDLNLSGVKLATLAACDTEAGKSVGGEGVAALSRAFLAAGVGTTVSSLWRVSDRSSEELMSNFYAHLAQGETAGAALRSAKLQLRRSGSMFAHPRYWAAYVLNGDAEMQTPRPTIKLLGVAALLVFALLVFMLVRQRQLKTAAVQKV